MYKRLAAYIIPYWYLAALVLLLTLINTLVAPFMAEINRNIFFAIEDKNMKMLILFGSLLLASVVGSMILNTIKTILPLRFLEKHIAPESTCFHILIHYLWNTLGRLIPAMLLPDLQMI